MFHLLEERYPEIDDDMVQEAMEVMDRGVNRKLDFASSDHSSQAQFQSVLLPCSGAAS